MVFVLLRTHSCLPLKYKYYPHNVLKILLRNGKKYSKTKYILKCKSTLRITSQFDTSLFHPLFKRSFTKLIFEKSCNAPLKRYELKTQRIEVFTSFKICNICRMNSKYLDRFLSAFLPISHNPKYFEEVYLTRSGYFRYIILESLRLFNQRLLKGSPSSESKLVEACSSTKLIPSKPEDLKYSEKSIDTKSANQKAQKCYSKQTKASLPFIKHVDHFSRKTKEDKSPDKKSRPNYFVAVQIRNAEIHKNIKEIQDYILTQDSSFEDCMIPIPTLHITLMVLNLNKQETYERARQVLLNIYKEHNEIMCENPLVLEFSGLSHFRNKVVYGKIKENDCFTRLCQLAQSVERHFADVDIFSTDEKREFNPHLTIAKIKFPKNKKKRPNKISEYLYEKFIDNYLGVERISGIQLLRMDGPKDSSGYYTGFELRFMPTLEDLPPSSFARMPDITEKKRKIREEVSEKLKVCKK